MLQDRSCPVSNCSRVNLGIVGRVYLEYKENVPKVMKKTWMDTCVISFRAGKPAFPYPIIHSI